MAKKLDMTYDPDFWLAVHKKEIPLPLTPQLKQEWYRGVMIPCGDVKDDEPISQEWAGFVVGTPKMYVWYWFDQAFPDGLIRTVMPELLKYSSAQMKGMYDYIEGLPSGHCKKMNQYFYAQLVALWKLARGIK